MSTALVEQTDAINALLRRADAGDVAALATVRGQASASPALWHEFGDLARQVRLKLVGQIAGANAFVAEAVAREVGEQPSPLEAALGERIAASWLHLRYVEAKYLQELGTLTYEQDAWHCRRIEQAERRYLRAIKALVELRKLPLPAVQVNIGARQVNVAG